MDNFYIHFLFFLFFYKKMFSFAKIGKTHGRVPIAYLKINSLVGNIRNDLEIPEVFQAIRLKWSNYTFDKCFKE